MLREYLNSIADKLREKLGTSDKINAQVFTDKIDEVYDAGYAKGAEEGGGGGINPEWTDWRYFSYHNNRNDLVAKLKHSDTSKGTSFGSMFYRCSQLTTIPLIDTSKGTSFGSMFYGCSQLTTIPLIDTSNGTSFADMFQNCTALKNVTFEGTFNVKSNISVFSSSPNLTVDSLMSFINALNNTGTRTYTVTIGSTNLAKLTAEQIQIATAKNITLA